MAANVDAILVRCTLGGDRACRRIEPIHEREIGLGAGLMVVTMMIDAAIGGVSPKLHQGVSVGGFGARAEVAGQEKQAKERHTPEESRPDLSRLSAEWWSHCQNRYFPELGAESTCGR